MTALPASRLPFTVGALVRRRLRELHRSPEQLAQAVDVPTEYIADLISGARRPPLPGRTDIYEKMTTFLRLGRNDLGGCARAERAEAAPAAAPAPDAAVRRLMLELCEPATARAFERRRGRRATAELTGFLQRLLDVTQGVVRRHLDDQLALRLAAGERGVSYQAWRLTVLEFLDATADTLTAGDLIEFVQPRIARWDVDFETGVLRVALRRQEPRDRGLRAPSGARRAAAAAREAEE
jgi:hypothetical protein